MAGFRSRRLFGEERGVGYSAMDDLSRRTLHEELTFDRAHREGVAPSRSEVALAPLADGFEISPERCSL